MSYRLTNAQKKGYAIIAERPASMKPDEFEHRWRAWCRENDRPRIQIKKQGNYSKIEVWIPDMSTFTDDQIEMLDDLCEAEDTCYQVWTHYLRFELLPHKFSRHVVDGVVEIFWGQYFDDMYDENGGEEDTWQQAA